MHSLTGFPGYYVYMSGYHLHQSPALESFPDQYPELFLAADPLSAPVYIVVQNAGLGEWLLRHLAGIRGAVMGPRILMPEQALRKFAKGFPAAGRRLDVSGRKGGGLLFMDGMKLTLYKALEEAIAGYDPVFLPVRDYLSASQTPEDPDSEGRPERVRTAIRGSGDRLWQLADKLAGTFYHYGMNCLPLVDAWEKKLPWPGLDERERSAEAWQSRLWNRLFHDRAPYTHLSRVLSEVMSSGESSVDTPGRVLLFGSMFLGETGLRFFRYLARDWDVHHFLFTPSRVFAAGPRKANQQYDLFTLGGLPESGSGKASRGGVPAITVHQPFLQDNARLSEGFAALLPELAPHISHEYIKAGIPADTVLNRLRLSLVEDRPMEGIVSDDGSLAIHDVTGPRREVEVLKDRILEALKDDTSLAPTQIGVLAPDISRYAPYLEVVFPGLDDSGEPLPGHLEFNLADLPSRTEAPYPAALATLLELPGSRFGRHTLLYLFSNPCFAPSAGDVETSDNWRHLAESLHVRWGLDEKHRESFEAADLRTGSWEFAFRRILAGYYHDEGDNPELFPAVLEGDSGADLAGRLIRAVRDLYDELGGLDQKNLTLKDWTLLWEDIAERWLTPRREGEDGENDQRDRLRMKGAIRDLLALNDDVDSLGDFSDGLLPWTAFSALLGEMINPANGRRGRYLSRGVTCASLKPMRAIPFRRIYVLGMDEGVWPGRELLTGFDLREKIPRFIDLSRESVDRYAFLETLFSCSDHISFFYTGRDPERGEPLAPSAPLVELLEHLGEGSASLHRRHPLLPFDQTALTGTGPLATSSREAVELAGMYRRANRWSTSPEPPLPAEKDVETVEWTELLKFLKNPVEYFYRQRLGLPRESLEEDTSENDVLEAGFLDWWQWRSQIILRDLQALRNPGKLIADFRHRIAMEGSVSDTPAAHLQAEIWENDARALAGELEDLERLGLDSRPPFSCRFQNTGGSAQELQSENAFLLECPSPQVISGEQVVRVTGTIAGLRHLISPVSVQGEAWTLLDFVTASGVRSGHNLSGWVRALMIGTLPPELRPRELRIFRVGGKSHPSRIYRFHTGGSAASPGKASAGEGSDVVILDNPAGVLKSLVECFFEGRRAPLLLYPQLADKLAAAMKTGRLNENLKQEAESGWNTLISDSNTPSSAIRDCSYRRNYLTTTDFSTDSFRRAWEELYQDGGIL